jgi:fucose permease
MNANTLDNQQRTRLFTGICMALIPTGASFALIAAIIPQLKTEFILTNTQVGAIAGAAIWGMAISLLVNGPLLEGFGMKKATWAAFLGHILGITVMISAVAFRDNPETGFWVLMIGAALFAGGNGMIEVAGNPLTAALYPENKAHKLNIFHAFFPLAIMVGSFIAMFLGTLSTQSFFGHWTFYLGLIYIPILFYGVLVLPQRFPKTEGAEAGWPIAAMFRFTLTHPLMYLLLLIMAIAIGLELGISRWIPAIYDAVGIEGLLMLSWISLIMMGLRFFSGPILKRVSPPALLTFAALFTCIGIFLFGVAQGNVTAFFAATFFGMGVAFYFPTIVGLVAERLPQTGSLGIVLTCGIGLLSAGTLGNMGVGALGDRQLANYLNEERQVVTVSLLETIRDTFPAHAAAAAASENPVEELGFTEADASRAMQAAEAALANIGTDTRISGTAAPQALRATGGAVLNLGGRLPADAAEGATAAIAAADPAVVSAFASQSIYHAAHLSNAIMGPAEGFAGQRALKQLAWVPLIMVAFFGWMFMSDRRKGGYKAVRLETVADKVTMPLDKHNPNEDS